MRLSQVGQTLLPSDKGGEASAKVISGTIAVAHEPLISTLALDQDIRELIVDFVAELPSRANAICAAASASDTETLSRLAHQLKGAAGSYGFPTITDAARALETAMVAGEDLTLHLNTLASLCTRVRAA